MCGLRSGKTSVAQAIVTSTSKEPTDFRAFRLRPSGCPGKNVLNHLTSIFFWHSTSIAYQQVANWTVEVTPWWPKPRPNCRDFDERNQTTAKIYHPVIHAQLYGDVSETVVTSAPRFVRELGNFWHLPPPQHSAKQINAYSRRLSTNTFIIIHHSIFFFPSAFETDVRSPNFRGPEDLGSSVGSCRHSTFRATSRRATGLHEKSPSRNNHQFPKRSPTRWSMYTQVDVVLLLQVIVFSRNNFSCLQLLAVDIISYRRLQRSFFAMNVSCQHETVFWTFCIGIFDDKIKQTNQNQLWLHPERLTWNLKTCRGK